jgi:hypothetical protein
MRIKILKDISMMVLVWDALNVICFAKHAMAQLKMIVYRVKVLIRESFSAKIAFAKQVY